MKSRRRIVLASSTERELSRGMRLRMRDNKAGRHRFGLASCKRCEYVQTIMMWRLRMIAHGKSRRRFGLASCKRCECSNNHDMEAENDSA